MNRTLKNLLIGAVGSAFLMVPSFAQDPKPYSDDQHDAGQPDDGSIGRESIKGFDWMKVGLEAFDPGDVDVVTPNPNEIWAGDAGSPGSVGVVESSKPVTEFEFYFEPTADDSRLSGFQCGLFCKGGAVIVSTQPGDVVDPSGPPQSFFDEMVIQVGAVFGDAAVVTRTANKIRVEIVDLSSGAAFDGAIIGGQSNGYKPVVRMFTPDAGPGEIGTFRLKFSYPQTGGPLLPNPNWGSKGMSSGEPIYQHEVGGG